MNQPKNIQNLFSEWGKQKRRLPQNNASLKNEALTHIYAPVPVNHAPVLSRFHTKKRFWVPLTLGVGLVAAFLLFINFQNGTPGNYTSNQTILMNGINSGLSNAPSPYNRQSSQRTGDLPAAPCGALPGIRCDVSSGSGYSFQDIVSNFYPFKSNETPVNDRREFLKTDYQATIKTQDVSDIAGRIQTTIRGYDGRIDSATVSPQSGYISFVIPAEKLLNFRMEIKALAGDRYITEQTSSTNLLSQKQSIEQQQTTAQSQLTQLNSERDQIINSHTKAAASLQFSLSVNAKKISDLQNEWNQNPDQRPNIETRLAQAQRERNSLSAQLVSENNNYENKLASINSEIQSEQNSLNSLGTQNTQLLDNVATVSGTIYLYHIDWWEIIDLYLPYYWPLYLSALALVLVYYLYRRHQVRFLINNAGQ